MSARCRTAGGVSRLLRVHRCLVDRAGAARIVPHGSAVLVLAQCDRLAAQLCGGYRRDRGSGIAASVCKHQTRAGGRKAAQPGGGGGPDDVAAFVIPGRVAVRGALRQPQRHVAPECVDQLPALEAPALQQLHQHIVIDAADRGSRTRVPLDHHQIIRPRGRARAVAVDDGVHHIVHPARLRRHRLRQPRRNVRGTLRGCRWVRSIHRRRRTVRQARKNGLRPCRSSNGAVARGSRPCLQA